jgi:putative ABC transport system permease protein
MEVVLGSKVATELNLKLGDNFTSAHGLNADDLHQHEEKPYKVVGIYQQANNVADQLIITATESIWAVHQTHEQEETHTHDHEEEHHEHHSDEGKEITALLLKFNSPLLALQMPRNINKNTNLQAASPAFETARLFQLLGVGFQIFQIFALILFFTAAVSIFITLYNALKERVYDLAMMRVLGANRKQLFTLLLTEGALLGIIGSFAGFFVAHLTLVVLVHYSDVLQKSNISGNVYFAQEVLVCVSVIIVALVTALIPAIQTYKTDITEKLSE